MRHHRFGLCAVLFLLLMAPTLAQGVDFMDMSKSYGDTMFNDVSNEISLSSQRNASQVKTSQRPRLKDPSKTSTAPNYQALGFRRTPEVSQQVAEGIARQLQGSLAAGRSRQELMDIVAGGELQKQFAAILQPYGFSDSDLADILAAQLIVNWQVANNTSYNEGPAAFQKVRDGMREALAREPWMKELTDSQKQGFAETVSVGTMLILGRYSHGRSTSDSAAISGAVADARAMLKAYAGIDLTSYQRTPNGLVRK